MKFFNIDFHASVITDIKTIFKKLGHETTDWTLSEHAWVFNKQKHSVPLLNNWKRIIKDKLWDSFYQEYKNELRQYDAFKIGRAHV